MVVKIRKNSDVVLSSGDTFKKFNDLFLVYFVCLALKELIVLLKRMLYICIVNFFFKAEQFGLYSTLQRQSPFLYTYTKTHIHTCKCLFKKACDYTEHIACFSLNVVSIFSCH